MFGNGIAKFRDFGQGLVVDVTHENSLVRGQPVSLRGDEGKIYMLLRVGVLNFHTLYLYIIDPHARDDGDYNVHGITEFPPTNLSAPKTISSMMTYLKVLAGREEVRV